jgi:DNA helicase-2/ATP-dependent DNA helicase PcrA
MTLHAAKGLEFPVVHIMAVEQGILPHERSVNNEAEFEEERRLAFVGITRAQEEAYLSYARMREFRGQTLYTIPSDFLQELPEGDVEAIDLSSSNRDYRPAADRWREHTAPASDGWYDTGFAATSTKKKQVFFDDAEPQGYSVGALVHHEAYGVGKITNVTGQGALQKLKIRFSVGGERTFMAAKAKLALIQKP